MPATVAVLDGVPHVGLTAQQLQRIAEGGPAVSPFCCNSCLVPAVDACHVLPFYASTRAPGYPTG